LKEKGNVAITSDNCKNLLPLNQTIYSLQDIESRIHSRLSDKRLVTQVILESAPDYRLHEEM
jgi:hypothetical protein